MMSAPVTTPDKLIELALRVEQATGGDRRLDAMIADLVDRPLPDDPDRDLIIHQQIIAKLLAGGDDSEIERYTSSLDSAMRLASDPRLKQFGGALGMLREALDRLYAAGLKDDALARFWTAACLRALSHQGADNG